MEKWEYGYLWVSQINFGERGPSTAAAVQLSQGRRTSIGTIFSHLDALDKLGSQGWLINDALQPTRTPDWLQDLFRDAPDVDTPRNPNFPAIRESWSYFMRRRAE